MRDILDKLSQWVERGEPVALATVVSTWGSSPRKVGAKMAITAAGEIAGSVSGGCVEGAVAEIGQSNVDSLHTSFDLHGMLESVGFEYKVSGATVEVTIDSVVQTLKGLVGPELDRKSTRLNSSHSQQSRMPSSA